MKLLKLSLFYILIITTSTSFSSSIEQKCINALSAHRIAESVEAKKTKAWVEVDKLASNRIEECKPFLGEKKEFIPDIPENSLKLFFYSMIADAYYDIADANIRLNKQARALWACEKCILFDDSIPECHMNKAIILIKLKHLHEADLTLDETKELIKIRITKLKEYISNPSYNNFGDKLIRSIISYKKMLEETEKMQLQLSSTNK